MRRGDVGRLSRNLALIVGLAGLIVLAAVSLFGPLLTAGDPQAQRLVLFFPDGTFKVPPTPPDQYYPLGTDPLGRDQLARILWGARLTFTVVLLALLLRALLAVSFGVAWLELTSFEGYVLIGSCLRGTTARAMRGRGYDDSARRSYGTPATVVSPAYFSVTPGSRSL